MGGESPWFLDEERVRESVRGFLEEDLGSGDVTTCAAVPVSARAEGVFLTKSSGTVAGLWVAAMTLELSDPSTKVQWLVEEGDSVSAGQVLGSVTGPARGILTAERVALNLLQRMSGIASATRRMVSAASSAGTGTRVLDTRKTVPGLRVLDKLAVVYGGGCSHRFGLWDMAMVKDNHAAAAGGVAAAVEKVAEALRRDGKEDVPLEAEVRSLEELEQVLAVTEKCRVKRIMLDNMAKGDDVAQLQEAVRRVKLSGIEVQTEASGNVTEENVAIIASTGVDFVSCGMLTHSVTAMDISLKIKLI